MIKKLLTTIAIISGGLTVLVFEVVLGVECFCDMGVWGVVICIPFFVFIDCAIVLALIA